MNGYRWNIAEVAPSSRFLVDRTGKLTVGTTDPFMLTIYISNDLSGKFKSRVIVHELAHALMLSYYLVDDLHSVVRRERWFEAEEMLCNLIADYGWKIFDVYRRLERKSGGD